MASSGDLPSTRSASSAKSIIMMAFFFTMPISRMMPISAMTPKILASEQQREDRAHARRGQRGENRDRVNVAFVQHAQHDVDGDERGQDQDRLVGERCFKRSQPCPGNDVCTLGGMPRSCAAVFDLHPPPAPETHSAPG